MKLGKYKHYKGKIYEALSIARHSETLEEHVVYQNTKDKLDVWVRPKNMFLETVVIDGKTIPRFEFLGE